MAANSLSVFSSDKAGDASFNCLLSISALKFSMSCWLENYERKQITIQKFHKPLFGF
jgi:hypothetical protein